MKKIFMILCYTLVCMVTVCAQKPVMGGAIQVNDLHVSRENGKLAVSMALNVTGVHDMDTDAQWLLTPALLAGKDTVRLTNILLAGKNRYYAYLRNPETLQGASLYRASKVDEIRVEQSLPYVAEMETAELVLLAGDCKCLNPMEQDRMDALAKWDYRPYRPVFAWMVPPPGKDSIVVEGQAFVDFRVNRTELDENYRNNPVELKKILNTIDVVKNDPDCSIMQVHIKGHASPEGSYANNERLARGRTATLKEYVRRHYQFEPGVVTSSYEPEDWKGLRDSVVNSALVHRAEILALVDSVMDLDRKDLTIRRRYPKDYAYMLEHYYPALRHSDYRVIYKVREYMDIEEACEVYQSAPAKLGLKELFDVAHHYGLHTEEGMRVLETAVLVYPNSEVANLNAATVALMRKDEARAERCLRKAGENPYRDLIEGILATMKEDYSSARLSFEKALQGGIQEAEGNLKELDRLEKNNKL